MSVSAISRGFGVVLSALTIAACAGGLGGRDYDRSDARRAYRAEAGQVVSVVPVRIEGQYTELGTVGGAAVGYSLGRIIGDGSGSRVAARRLVETLADRQAAARAKNVRIVYPPPE